MLQYVATLREQLEQLAEEKTPEGLPRFGKLFPSKSFATQISLEEIANSHFYIDYLDNSRVLLAPTWEQTRIPLVLRMGSLPFCDQKISLSFEYFSTSVSSINMRKICPKCRGA